ncbi:unnamed protein product [Arabis nemorensis]|uniref:DUF1985 domain-containing protein n=1 Tax=Arabis nemorensis TaxID=586526 RepID=A0A565BK02_9BRAS|nr:unnamed protein product [Arabis nemorensis]
MKINLGDGPSWNELLEVLDFCRTWSYDKKKMVGLLSVLNVGIYWFARSSRITLMAAKRVLDLEAFERYPWGCVSFRELVKSINIACLEGGSLTLHGCVHAMLVWAYESVTILGEKFRKRREAPIPLLHWASSRARYNLETVLLEEKKSHGKVRVRHLLIKPLVEIYPSWEGKNEDKVVDNMIRDIIGGCLDESVWDVQRPKDKKIQKISELEEKEEKEKNKKKETKTDGKREKKEKKRRNNSEPLSEEKSDKESEDVDMSIPLTEIVKKKRREHKESRRGEERVEKKKVEESGEVISLLNSLLSKVDELGKKYEGIDSRMESLENKKGKATELDAHSKVGDEGDGSKNEDLMSWMVEQQATSQADFPINCVVRNMKVGTKVLRNVETAVEKKKAIVEFIDMTKENNEAKKS